ncbi:MAG: HemK family protein methyltransferase [Actinobacteria bacterium]|nr:MAG: HemK family protein methyltransferase [Actinomycetota bacterium]
METSFYDLDFLTAPGRVFTPRPATERLVDAALERIDGKPVRVADVGTGTGAVAVALAVNRPDIEVWATDTSEEAVQLARANAERHGVDDRVHVLHGDLLSPVPMPMDVVVANLPYLPERERDELYDDEPAEAVYAPGDGLAPYRRLLDVCREGRLVSPGGTVLIQFRREPLSADCWQLEDLREELEAKTAAA